MSTPQEDESSTGRYVPPELPTAEDLIVDDANEQQLEAFWTDVKTRTRMDSIGTYAGSTVLGSLRPPAWAFGSTPAQADAELALVLAGSKTESSAPLRDYADTGAPLPEVGAVSIVLDGHGKPRALIATTEVVVEGEGANQMVRERFRLLYPTKRHR
ncbi:MAG: hypothetical protein Q4G67_06585 [Actinomycetia bacterium]|nr:hypothetical protein [Actinomycetes bacterium]